MDDIRARLEDVQRAATSARLCCLHAPRDVPGLERGDRLFVLRDVAAVVLPSCPGRLYVVRPVLVGEQEVAVDIRTLRLSVCADLLRLPALRDLDEQPPFQSREALGSPARRLRAGVKSLQHVASDNEVLEHLPDRQR
jgi:hypothetical protein